MYERGRERGRYSSDAGTVWSQKEIQIVPRPVNRQRKQKRFSDDVGSCSRPRINLRRGTDRPERVFTFYEPTRAYERIGKVQFPTRHIEVLCVNNLGDKNI